MLQKLSQKEMEELLKPKEPKYLTARKLGISKWMRDGLIKTLNLFKSGEVKPFGCDHLRTYNQSWSVEYFTSSEGECYTSCCILGWATVLMGKPAGGGYFISEELTTEDLKKLYAGNWNPKNDVDLAIKALETYLTTGKGPSLPNAS